MFSLAISIPQAAAAIGVGRSKIYEMLADGSIKSCKLGGRRLILVKSLEELVTRKAEESYK